MEQDDSLDPWGETSVKNYDRLYSEFGIGRLDELIPPSGRPSLHMRRGIDFGQRDLSKVLDAVDGDRPFAVMSGIKPTGVFHLGTKMTADDMIYFQSLSKRATVFYTIADVEAYNDNGLSFVESSKIAIQNVADILALGLDPEHAIVYKQSEEIRVMRLATIFSRGVTNNMLKAIYGERQVGLYLSALIQAGDILMPQLPEFGGPKPVLVPVGADQDPHIRLARDLANRFHDDFGFVAPSSIYHKLIKSLDGGTRCRSGTGLVVHPRRGPFLRRPEGHGRVHRRKADDRRAEEDRRRGGKVPRLRPLSLPLRPRRRVREEGLRRMLRWGKDVRRL